MRLTRIEPRFVEFVPAELEPGVVYIAMQYGAVVHACCCGCGEKVTTPLSPAQWSLTYNGEELSLHPSVGNGALPCDSHYFISRNEVRWARPLSASQTRVSLNRDAAAAEAHYKTTTGPESRRARIGRWVRAVLRSR